jgi:hypothetical protein
MDRVWVGVGVTDGVCVLIQEGVTVWVTQIVPHPQVQPFGQKYASFSRQAGGVQQTVKVLVRVGYGVKVGSGV